MALHFRPDRAQQRVIEAQGGYHLVLAPPGCGKTQILTERILRARSKGIPPDDMLSLTFTNRAARGMLERLQAYSDLEEVGNVYVGNVHRYCSKFLFDNALIPAETSIVDDDDAFSIVARICDDDEQTARQDFQRRKAYQTIILFAHFMQQIRSRHDREIRMHPECLSRDDIAALRKICEVQHLAFTPQTMVDVYEHADTYRATLQGEAYDIGAQQIIIPLLRKMELAYAYERYMRDNRLMDFEDLLIFAYDFLRNDTDGKYHRYKWIQIDEVQDLNLMQLCIVDMLTAREDFTVMYLGDEQQAIFSFMGAKMSTLEMLKTRCEGHLHRLYTNHRSPKYLLEVLNKYASKQLNIDASLLPQANNEQQPAPDDLTILSGSTYESELMELAHRVAHWYSTSQTETTAVIVSSNADADMVSKRLSEILVPHFKVSGIDLFSLPEVKLLLAHFNVLNNEHNFIGWSHLLHGLKVYDSAAPCRQLVRDLVNCSITPSDLLQYSTLTTYVKEFARAYETSDIVVFDTETTGLDMLTDDIAQIAAVKMRQGRVVEGSHFNVFIRTEREVPLKLGDLDNPLIEELKRHELLSPEDALRQFIDYVGDAVLVGHNVEFDACILHHNLLRYLSEDVAVSFKHESFDTLKLARLLKPNLVEYKLRHLISVLDLDGVNSHLADEDVNATCSLLNYCYKKALEVIPRQDALLSDMKVMEHLEKFQQRYKIMYTHTYVRMDDVQTADSEPLLLQEMRTVYEMFVRGGHVKEVEKIDYIFGYLQQELLCGEIPSTLKGQLSRYMVEINTLKESDLCNSEHIPDRVFVSTVHKAKGLEFDNVVVFDAVDGRYPNYYTRLDSLAVNEDARKFYVAMSRAKRRLCISYCMSMRVYSQIRPRELTPFMKSILRHFTA